MKNAIIVPTHQKDFHWTYDLLMSASDKEHIIIVVDSEDDKIVFDRKVTWNCECEYTFLIAPPYENLYGWSTPTYKKIRGLAYAIDKFDYVATIDTESLFLKPVCPELKTIWDNNCLVCNESTQGHNYIESCLKDLGLDKFHYSTNYYWWFNDIQVYPTNLIQEFLHWLPKRISPKSFDYLMFGIFMVEVKKHKLRMIDGISHDGLIEELPLHMDMVEQVSQVNWSTWFPGVEKYENIKMLFHLDRFPKP